MDDHYAILEVAPTASEEEIKQAYRSLQKRWHPDKAGQAGMAMSSKINVAYETLINPDARRMYNLTPRRNKRASVVTKEGLVGPMQEKILRRSTVPQSGAEYELTSYELADCVREWAKTMAFTTELPLPFPIQVDEIEDGVRIAVITVASGSVRPMGELIISVFEDEGSIEMEVVRRWATEQKSGPLPGEQRIMKLFEAEFADLIADKSKAARPLLLSGLFAAMTSFALPLLPPVPSLNKPGGGYNAYRLQRSCRLDATGRRPVSAADTSDEQFF